MGVKNQGIKPGRFHWPPLYTDLFAASCGSLGEFTDIKQSEEFFFSCGCLLASMARSVNDIKQSEEGYAMTRQMKHFNFPVRNLDGTFYAQVHPFDPSFFAVKVHPSGVLLFTPSIKAEIGDLVYNGPKQNDDSTASTPPPGRFVYFTGSRTSNDPPPGLWNLMPMPVGQIGNSVPMSRRPTRE